MQQEPTSEPPAPPSHRSGTVPDGIEIVPIGELPRDLLERIASGLRVALGCQVSLAALQPTPQAAYQSNRGQYNASMILNAIRPSVWKRGWKRLGILNVDIFSGGLNFVFGQADLSGATAVISLARLTNEFYGVGHDDGLLVERAVKEAVHEIGHTLGLVHCRAECVMYFSNSLLDTDKKPGAFCAGCRARLAAGRTS